ncbi:MAG: PVC-type heme-binding CxxCH protein [Gemmataceae bacterium]
MRRSCPLLAFLLMPAFVAAQPRNPHIADTPPLRPEAQVKTFHLPPGFVIELVAADPDIKKPININFDAKGRLWVTGSEEYPFPAKGHTPKDTVKILEDFGPDGRARKITTFADGLNIPIGVQPLADCKSALIYSIPAIYLMTDTDGDGKADERKVLYSGYGYRDTHGMTGEFQYWLDGWIYCCHGYSNESTVSSKGDTKIRMQSGNTYRIKPDGSRIEQFTWGQVNPFGLSFDERGFLYSTDCHTWPIYQLIKGAYYPSFGKPHDGMGFGPETITHDHGSTAIAGITYYADDQFPVEYRGNIFVGNVVTNRVNRDTLAWTGVSPKGTATPDFVVCDDPWFRPVDIKLGPDGALYIADFYNRIIGHYEVPLDHPGRDREKGRIWRIRYAGKDGKTKVRPLVDLTKLSTPDLVKELSRTNLTTRMLATQVLVARPKDEVDAAVIKGLPDQKVDGAVCSMWVLERHGSLTDELLKRFHEEEGLARSHVMKLLAERPKLDAAWHKAVVAGLKNADPLVQRGAAEVLAAHPANENVRPLLDLRHAVKPTDSHLTHVVRLALREQLVTRPGLKGLDTSTWSEKDFRAIADVCLGVHSADAAAFLRDYLTRFKENPERVLGYVHHVVRYGADDGGRWALDLARSRHAGNISYQARMLNTVKKARQERGAGLGKEELAWAEELVSNVLKSDRSANLDIALDLTGDLKLMSLTRPVLDLVMDAKLGESQRRRGVIALVKLDPAAHVPALVKLLTAGETIKGVREQIALSLAATNRPETHEILVKTMETTPAGLQSTIAFGLAGSAQGAEQLLKAVSLGKASPRLLTEPALARRLQETKLPVLKERIATLTKGYPSADARALEQQETRRKGFLSARAEAGRGKMIFTKHCAACHQIGGEGAKVGPQLDGIGIRGVERLLEDILDPNRNVDQAFRATFVSLKGGQVYTGLAVGKEGKVLVLIDNLGKEVRIPVDEIDEQRAINVSPMPATFFEAIPERDFFDLIAYLLEQRVKGR